MTRGPTSSVDPRTISPLRYLAVTIVGIFVAEVIVMVLISVLQVENPALAALLDATWIALVVLLINYRWMARPLMDSLRALHGSEERFRDYAETASDWFWEMDSGLRFSYFSDRFDEKMPGLRSRLIGGSIDAFCECASSDGMRRYLDDVGQRRPFRSFECGLRGDGGEVAFIRLSGKPLFDKAGAFQGYRGTGSDMTQERRSRAELEQINRNLSKLAADLDAQREQAEAASLAKSQFLANMSHELRTPLNAVMGFSELIKDELLGPGGNPKYREYAADIYLSGSHLLELINDVLDMSRIEAGKYRLEYQDVSVREVMDECLRLVVGRLSESGVSVIDSVPLGLPPVRTDRRALKQIILNLLANAVKFTPRGGTVSVNAAVVGDRFEIAVADTGIGMTRDEAARAVEPFVQIEREKGRTHEGAGLGLALSKSLIEMQGGNLSIKSAVGHGSTFTISLPTVAPSVVTSG